MLGSPGAARRARRVAAVVLVALGLAACSGGGRSPAGPDSAAAPATTATQGASATAATAPGSATTAPPGQGATTAPPGPAATAAGLAATLTRAERAIRDPATPDRELPALGHAQQRAYRAVVRDPALLPTVLSLVPATLPWTYLAAINVVETRTGRIRGSSPAGAQGPMQFLPSTWRRYGAGGDVDSVHDAILAAARLLRANGAPADMAGALYAYNHSPLYVRAVTAYAQQMRADQRAFLGYHQWQVYYGDTLLPEGYPARPASRG